jgi:hypothetical protein
MIIKTLFIAFTIIHSPICFAQQNKMVKKWVASKIEAGNSNTAEDLARQIKILDVTKKTGENGYTGSVEYGMLPVIKQPCSITITGKNISIEANEQKWTGEIAKIENDKMKCTLGSLTYHFKYDLVPLRRPGSPQAKFNAAQLLGSWQETGRVDNNNNLLPIGAKDSIYLRISKDSAMYLPGAGYVPIFGSLDITKGDNLNIALVDFKLVSLTGEKMELDDYNNGIHTFKKTTLPYPFERKKPFMKNATVDLSAASLLKNWFVYRIAPALASQNNNAISAINIWEKNTDENYSGNIEFGNWVLKDPKTLPCTFIFNGNEMRIEASSYTWNGQIYKANGDTLIYGKEGEIMYYFKKIEKITPPALDTGTSVIDLRPESLISKWSVYNAEANPGFIKRETGILRGLNIINSTGNMKYDGKVIFDYFGTRLVQDCTIQFSGDLIKGSWVFIETKDYNWNIEIFKADGREIIMGKKSDGIRYYFQN